MLGNWKSSPVITKHGPILTAKDIPYKATLVFNAGVCKMNGKYIMAFRNDYGDYHTDTYKWDPSGISVGIATSDDGIHWTPEKSPWCELRDGGEILNGYDPRLTVIDGVCYCCVAVDTKHGLRGGILKTDDFVNYEMISMTVPDNRLFAIPIFLSIRYWMGVIPNLFLNTRIMCIFVMPNSSDIRSRDRS